MLVAQFPDWVLVETSKFGIAVRNDAVTSYVAFRVREKGVVRFGDCQIVSPRDFIDEQKRMLVPAIRSTNINMIFRASIVADSSIGNPIEYFAEIHFMCAAIGEMSSIISALRAGSSIMSS